MALATKSFGNGMLPFNFAMASPLNGIVHLQVCSPAMVVLVCGPQNPPVPPGINEYVVSPAEFTTKHWSFDWTPRVEAAANSDALWPAAR